MKAKEDHTDRPNLSYWVLEILTAINIVENKALNKIKKERKNYIILPPEVPTTQDYGSTVRSQSPLTSPPVLMESSPPQGLQGNFIYRQTDFYVS